MILKEGRQAARQFVRDFRAKHMKKTKLCLCMASLAMAVLLTGCSEDVSQEEETTAAIMEATNTASSVETSISLIMDARIGSAGSVDGHNASLTSDITIKSNAKPVAYHAEIFSRMLVDGATTRENLEYYVVPEDHDMVQYEYEESKDEWARTTLSREEALSIIARTGVVTDWNSLLESAERVDELDTDDNDETPPNLEYTGKIDASILQELFGNKIFGTFMYSTERLLQDTIPFVLTIDGSTFLPKQLSLDFKDSFIVSDMTFDAAEVTVKYSDWNDVDKITVPKKVTIVAADPDADFYNTFFAWNLFLPYIHGQTESGGGAGNQGLSFVSSWDTFQVRIDKGMTQLPLLYEDLNKLGYSIDSSASSTILEPNSYVENILVVKGTDKLLCTFYNPETTPQPIINCGIGSIDVIAANIVQNSISVYLPGEVTLGITREALESAYGKPDESISGFSADTYIYKGETENQQFVAEISPVTNLVIRLKLVNVPLNPQQSTDPVVDTSANPAPDSGNAQEVPSA